MLWTGETNAGFCEPDVTPWLPVDTDDSNTVEVVDYSSVNE